MSDKMGIMGNVLLISELIGTDVRSRSNAGIIQSVVDGMKEGVILDFSEVTFISRSFAAVSYTHLTLPTT